MLAIEGSRCCYTRAFDNRCSGGHSGGVTPVPIPNTEVKPACADGTWGENPWESRSPPDFLHEQPRPPAGLLDVLGYRRAPCLPHRLIVRAQSALHGAGRAPSRRDPARPVAPVHQEVSAAAGARPSPRPAVRPHRAREGGAGRAPRPPVAAGRPNELVRPPHGPAAVLRVVPVRAAQARRDPLRADPGEMMRPAPPDATGHPPSHGVARGSRRRAAVPSGARTLGLEDVRYARLRPRARVGADRAGMPAPVAVPPHAPAAPSPRRIGPVGPVLGRAAPRRATRGRVRTAPRPGPGLRRPATAAARASVPR